MAQTQSFKKHSRWDPIFHFFIVPVLLVNVVHTAVFFTRFRFLFGTAGIWFTLVSIALLLLAIKARGYALKAQDRVIRLEERLRLKELVSASELIELESLTIRQYIALRFASNAELPDLARRAIRENLTEKQIKAAIVSWRPDTDRV